MLTSKRLKLILTYVAAVLIAALMQKYLVNMSLRSYAAIIGGLIVMFTTFVSPAKSLYLMAIALIFSPEISIGSAGSRDIVIRVEDFMLLFMAFGYLANSIVKKKPIRIPKTPLNKPIKHYTFAMLISTLIGIALYNNNILKSSMYFLKYVEYFMIFYIVINNIENRKHARKLIYVFIICSLMSGLHGLGLIQRVGRVAAPFDVGEANTFGMYIVFMISILLGLIQHSKSKRRKYAYGFIILILIPPFLYTLSRSSYAALIGIYLVHLIFSKRRKMLLFILVLAVILFVVFQPETITERVKSSFENQSKTNVVQVGDVKFDQSFSERVTSWKIILNELVDYPLFGKGLTGQGFVDGQYFRNLIEFGIIGFIFFFLLIRGILRFIWRVYKKTDDGVHRGLCLGVFAAFIGMLIHAISSNTFMIVRIMEPLWFSLALIYYLSATKPSDDESKKIR